MRMRGLVRLLTGLLTQVDGVVLSARDKSRDRVSMTRDCAAGMRARCGNMCLGAERCVRNAATGWGAALRGSSRCEAGGGGGRPAGERAAAQVWRRVRGGAAVAQSR